VDGYSVLAFSDFSQENATQVVLVLDLNAGGFALLHYIIVQIYIYFGRFASMPENVVGVCENIRSWVSENHLSTICCVSLKKSFLFFLKNVLYQL
jgi:hypothetical protein